VKNGGTRSSLHFKTIKAIRAAVYEELCAVVPKNTARAVLDYYSSGEGELI
jgi:hypothetical protein